MTLNTPSEFFEQRKKIENTFLDFFTHNKYLLESRAELITSDDTLLFTNDTVTPWKHYLIDENIPIPGVCMKQPCVRLQGIRDTITEEIQTERNFERFIGYFNSLGILAHPSQKEELQHLITTLLINKYNIPTEDIKLFGSKEMNFIRKLEETISAECDSRDKNYYRWKYGLPNISGFGATFCLRQTDGRFLEIGQIIEISKGNKCIGYEFGFGAETFQARKNKSSTYQSWTINDCVPNELRFKTLLDIYSCFGAVCTIPENLFKEQHKDSRIRLAQSIAKLENIFNISEHTTHSILEKFILMEFGITQLVSKLYEELYKAREQQNSMRNNIELKD